MQNLTCVTQCSQTNEQALLSPAQVLACHECRAVRQVDSPLLSALQYSACNNCRHLAHIGTIRATLLNTCGITPAPQQFSQLCCPRCSYLVFGLIAGHILPTHQPQGNQPYSSSAISYSPDYSTLLCALIAGQSYCSCGHHPGHPLKGLRDSPIPTAILPGCAVPAHFAAAPAQHHHHLPRNPFCR